MNDGCGFLSSPTGPSAHPTAGPPGAEGSAADPGGAQGRVGAVIFIAYHSAALAPDHALIPSPFAAEQTQR